MNRKSREVNQNLNKMKELYKGLTSVSEMANSRDVRLTEVGRWEIVAKTLDAVTNRSNNSAKV